MAVRTALPSFRARIQDTWTCPTANYGASAVLAGSGCRASAARTTENLRIAWLAGLERKARQNSSNVSVVTA